ncbi:hypothetical protein FB45DRAFT_930086 [Roridomyces roridus]|uniref:Uncharacterized protein n=1 Tax=Roridomyces roridus TaxID=1738132 RepID=A0AAD7BGN6_9AGAR|nr:hypothetical protein FB45DRAFT_930086 [Roridomyces roridus]
MGRPLKIPELLDVIVSFVDAPKDLRVSALVHRSWTLPSQARLFSSIYFNQNPLQARHLVSALQGSPHLAPLIQSLTLINIVSSALERWGALSFSGLRTLTLRTQLIFERGVIETIHTLISSPSLVSVTMSCHFRDRGDSLRIWDGCSNTIKNLTFNPGDGVDLGGAHEPSPRASGRIKLESFGSTRSLEVICSWLQHPSCPFDISGLSGFRCNDWIRGAFADIIAPALASIEVLSLMDPRRTKDISRFHRLQQLDLELDFPFDEDFGLICTIHSEDRHRLQALRLHVSRLDVADARALARELCQLQSVFSHIQMVHICVVVASPEVRMNLASYFGQLDPKTALHWEFDAFEPEMPWYTRLV